MPQVQFNLESLDDPLFFDGTPSFDGGMVSNERVNLLKPNQSASLLNFDINPFGRLITRKGTSAVGATSPDITANPIQGLIDFESSAYKYIIAAQSGKLWSWNGTAWTQIATGGVEDEDAIVIVRLGQVNNPGSSYAIGTLTFNVTGMTGVVSAGEKFAFGQQIGTNNFFEYTIVSSTFAGGFTTSITIAQPGLVTIVYDQWWVVVKRVAAVNGNFAAGATSINIEDYTGVVNNGELFVIQGENVWHTISAHTETSGNTTALTLFSPGLQASYLAGDTNVYFAMCAGNDKIFWCDGIGNIFSWDGLHTGNLGNPNIYNVWVSPTTTVNAPPVAPTILIWFQNRLIASGIAATPDTIYFSNFLDETTWNSIFQTMRVGGGESDPIVQLVPWTGLNVAVFKRNSVYVVNTDPAQNPTPDDPTALVNSFAVSLINKYVGCIAAKTAVQVGGGASTVGGDIFFLSDTGLWSLRRVVTAENIQQLGNPISFPVQDYFDRINQSFAYRSVAAYHNHHYFIALPLDSNQFPSHVLVYNTLIEAWCGVWTGWTPTAFAVRFPQGAPAFFPTFCMGNSNGFVSDYLDGIPESSETPSTYQDRGGAGYMSQIITRGYVVDDYFAPKTGMNCELEFVKSLATVQVDAIPDNTPFYGTVGTFSSQSSVPTVIPVVLPADHSGFLLPTNLLNVKSMDLQRYGQWRQFQFSMETTSPYGKLSMRSIKVTGFHDTIQLQTTPTIAALPAADIINPASIDPGT